MGQIDLLPAKRAQFGRSQPMSEGQQDHGGVAVSVAIVASRLHQPLDLAFGEVYSGAIVGVRQPTSRNCSLLDGWCLGNRCRIHWATSLFKSLTVPIISFKNRCESLCLAF